MDMRLLGAAAVLAFAIVACGPSQQEQPAAGASTSSDTLTTLDRRLLAAARIALPPAGLTPESLPDPSSVGAGLLAQYCVQCHALPAPAMHSAVDWPIVLRRMWVRIDMMHGELGLQSPPAPARLQLSRYLTSRALLVAARLPAGPSRELFAATCSRCHAIPDPRAHAAADWPGVVLRMEQNMVRMRVSVPSREQSQQIMTYLDGASRRR